MRILIAEDEAVLAKLLKAELEKAGFAVDLSADGEEACHLGESEPYDAIVLDLGLPLRDGMTVLKHWRSCGIGTPVLVLTARESWSDRIKGMDAGADDYVCKPFHTGEVIARLRALIRRSHGLSSTVLTCGGVSLDTARGEVTQNGQAIDLTAAELKTLSYLMHHQDRIVSRSELTEHIYAQDYDRDSNTIEVFIGRLRQKLGRNLVKTVRGLGYKLSDEGHDKNNDAGYSST